MRINSGMMVRLVLYVLDNHAYNLSITYGGEAACFYPAQTSYWLQSRALSLSFLNKHPVY